MTAESIPVGLYHAVLDQDTHTGASDTIATCGIWRNAGEALCGVRGPWPEPPDGLFPPLVSCPTCLRAAQQHNITITGQPATLASRP